ncbi:MAG: hypothetical protein RLZZ597_2463 [Cyanobacteriota bacterium]
MANRGSGGFWGGLVLGSAIGAVTGLLLAPRTGRETRKILKKSADALPELVADLSTSVHLQADRLSATALANWEHTLARLKESIAAGQAASLREYESLTQSAKGSAETEADQPSEDL